MSNLKHHSQLIRDLVNHHANNINGQTHHSSVKDRIAQTSQGNPTLTEEQVKQKIEVIHNKAKR
jgi:hypothetical protein